MSRQNSGSRRCGVLTLDCDSWWKDFGGKRNRSSYLRLGRRDLVVSNNETFPTLNESFPSTRTPGTK